MNPIIGLFLALLTQLSRGAPPQKIVGGSDASINEFPYLVSVRYYDSHICGGVFISKQHILTAAHCVQRDDRETGEEYLVATQDLTVASGSNNCINVKNVHKVASFAVYPDYNGEYNIEHDIAVIKLTKPIVEDDTQRVIKVPSSYTWNDKFGYVVGWGIQQDKTGPVSTTLKKAPMWTLSNSQCSTILPYPVSVTQMCARYTPGIGFCDGDSGGPLIVNDEVVGVVSASYECGTGLPDIYTRVHSYYTWIQQQIA